MFELIPPFMVGLIGSLHCFGMCGPLVLAYSLHYKSASQSQNTVEGQSRSARWSGPLVHHLAFHVGRVTTYGLLGMIVAGLFGSLEVQKFSTLYRGGFVILSGVLLLTLGLIIYGILPLPAFAVRLLSPSSSGFGKSLARLASSNNPASKLMLGLGAGLIPCGLTWAMLIAAASTLDPIKGLLTMALFGLGTIPLLFMAGMSASFLCLKMRLFGERAAAISVMGMGVLLLIRGTGIVCGLSDHCGPLDLLTGVGLLK